MKIKFSPQEKKIVRLLKKEKLGGVHGWEHVKNVVEFSLTLQKYHGGNKKILIAASLFHDLGRIKPELHGKFSRKESVRLAKKILAKAGYTSEEIQLVCQIIEEHDQPKFHSKILESRILKDADFLDGFGARGILRAAYYTGESRQGFDELIKRLATKMKQRIDGLEFEESRKAALEQYSLVPWFLELFEKKPKIEKTFEGKLIVFEGISGTGKETQARLLKKYLKKQGNQVEIVFHPQPRLKKILKNWRKINDNREVELFLFVADRMDAVKRIILPALQEGKYVISLRNKMSTMVFQQTKNYSANFINFLYSFEPEADVIFYFDMTASEAMKRINLRFQKTGEEKGYFEKLSFLKRNRKRYERVLKDFKQVVRVDAKESIENIHEDIVKSLKKLV